MSVAQGYEKVPTNGLVFMYDVADSTSYKGEPTTNYQIDWSPWTVGGINTDVTGTSDQGPVKNAKTWKFEKIGGSNQWNGWESTYGGIWTGNSGDIWTTSYWYKTSAPAGATNFGIGNFYLSDWSRPYNVSILANSNGIIADGQWHYNSTTTQLNENYSNAIIVDGPSWGYSTQTGTLYINGLQWEKKSHPTPFAGFTRLAIEALKPLAGNATLDLSNVSFDSNGQIYFDGTNDYIDLGYAPFSGTGDFTIDTVYTLNTLDTHTIIGNYPASSLQFMGRYGLYINGSCYFPSSLGPGTYHATATRESGVCKLYLNGTLVNTVSNGNNIGTNSFVMGKNTSGGEVLNGVVPIMKLYNRALTQAEVKQNYDKYKTRFNLS